MDHSPAGVTGAIPSGGALDTGGHGCEAGVASAVLAASQPGAAGEAQWASPGPYGSTGSSHQAKIDPLNYISHMNFISGKAALKLYATDALIKYEAALTDRVISGQYVDWVSADPECVALHLGAYATYTVRHGGLRWSRQGSSYSIPGRDFSEWPKEVCWLFNNTTCYFPPV